MKLYIIQSNLKLSISNILSIFSATRIDQSLVTHNILRMSSLDDTMSPSVYNFPVLKNSLVMSNLFFYYQATIYKELFNVHYIALAYLLILLKYSL